MALVVRGLEGCCAVREIHLLSSEPSPESAMRTLRPYFETTGNINVGYAGNGRKGYHKPFLIFTEAEYDYYVPPERRNYGQNLADFIKANNLGTVQKSGARRNWTANMVNVYVWTIKPRNIRKYYKSLPAQPATAPVVPA